MNSWFKYLVYFRWPSYNITEIQIFPLLLPMICQQFRVKAVQLTGTPRCVYNIAGWRLVLHCATGKHNLWFSLHSSMQLPFGKPPAAQSRYGTLYPRVQIQKDQSDKGWQCGGQGAKEDRQMLLLLLILNTLLFLKISLQLSLMETLCSNPPKAQDKNTLPVFTSIHSSFLTMIFFKKINK